MKNLLKPCHIINHFDHHYGIKVNPENLPKFNEGPHEKDGWEQEKDRVIRLLVSQYQAFKISPD